MNNPTPPLPTPHQISAFIETLSQAGVRDVRLPPEILRQREFVRGWRRYGQRAYSSKTLQKLTWNNLGYRLAGWLGTGSDTYAEAVFAVAASQYGEDRAAK